MKPQQLIGILALVAGIILLVFGLDAGNSFISEIKKTFTGNPTERSMWMIIGGAALGIFGLVALIPRSKTA